MASRNVVALEDGMDDLRNDDLAEVRHAIEHDTPAETCECESVSCSTHRDGHCGATGRLVMRMTPWGPRRFCTACDGRRKAYIADFGKGRK
jgi:hypothetical protein